MSDLQKEITYYTNIRGTYEHNGYEDLIFRLIDSLAALEAENTRLDYLHKLDHSLADQWKARADSYEALLDEVKNATMVIYGWGNKAWHKDRPDLTKAFNDSADLLQAILDKREQDDE